jgi:hypothetical protein
MQIVYTGVGTPLENNAPVDGFTMTGPLILAEYPLVEMQAANKGYVDVADNALSLRVSDIESSLSALVTDPVAKTYVDSQDALKLNLTGGIMTGDITLPGAPTSSLHAATKSYVDTADSALSGRVTTTESNISGLTTTKADKSYVDSQDNTKLDLVGGTMTGLLTLSGAPVVALHAATKAYVDSADATKLALAGGTMTGAITLSGAPTIALHPATKSYVDSGDAALDTRLDAAEASIATLSTDPTTKSYVDTQDNLKVSKSGGIMTGLLTLSGDPTTNMHAATKAYADLMLPLIGGTLTGALTLAGAPTAGLHAATKSYVDTADAALNTRLTTAEGTITTLNTDSVTKTYVDNQVATKVALAGGTMTGLLTLSGAPTVALHAATKTYVDTADALKLNLSGGTLTGLLTLSGAPTVGLHAATKTYVDAADAALDTRLDTAEGTIATLNTDPVTKSYVDTADGTKVAKAGSTMTGALVLSGDPTLALHASTKQYSDSILSTHASNASLHLTAGQNTFLDAVTVSSTEVNYLTGVTSAVQGQLNAKLPLAGGTLTGNLVMNSGTVVTLNTLPTNSTDAVNKSYVDGLIQGLKWKDPILDPNLIATGLNTPPGSPTAGYTYVVGSAPTGGWAALASRLVTYSGSAWVDVLGRALQVGDRIGVGFEVAAGVLDVSVSANDNKILVVSGVGPLTYTVETNSANDTTLVTDSDSYYFGSNYTYTVASGWVKVSSNINFSTGTGLILAGSVLGVNLSAGLEEVSVLGASKLRIKQYPNGGILLTTDGTTASTADNASIAVNVDNSTISITAGKVALSSGTQASLAGKLNKAGDTMTGALTLSGDPTVALHSATKQYVDAQTALKLSLTGGTMTGLLTLSANPTAALHAATRGYVDANWTTLNNRLTTAEGTIATLSTDPTTKTYVDGQDALKLNLTGGTLTGLLTLSGAPTVALHATTKTYVDTADALKLNLSGGTLTGALTLSGAPTVALHAATKAYADLMLPLTGGTLTGLLTLSGAPTLGLHAATKTYVDAGDSALNTRLTTAEGTIATLNSNPTTKTYVDTQDALKLSLTGGTLTGALTLSGAPTVALHAATKAYADTMLPLAGGTMTGALTLSGAPTLGLHATTKTYVDNADVAMQGRIGTLETTVATLNANPVTKAYVDTQDATKLALAGGTMTGLLVLSGAPTVANHATTKTYVDTADALKLNKAGDTMTGALTLSGAPTVALHAATKAYADTMVPLAGGTMTGALVLSGAPTVGNHPATKTYTDTADALKLNKAGDTMTGALTLSGAPTADLHAATKLYIDAAMDAMAIYHQILYMNVKY